MSTQQVVKQINVASTTEAEALNYGVTEENNKKRYNQKLWIGVAKEHILL